MMRYKPPSRHVPTHVSRLGYDNLTVVACVVRRTCIVASAWLLSLKLLQGSPHESRLGTRTLYAFAVLRKGGEGRS
jgi:hypothetical protein